MLLGNPATGVSSRTGTLAALSYHPCHFQADPSPLDSILLYLNPDLVAPAQLPDKPRTPGSYPLAQQLHLN